jgi:2'-5' RNA ligase
MADVNRCFLAVFPPPNFQQQVSDRFAALRQKETGIKWVDTHNLHMTLFFWATLQHQRKINFPLYCKKSILPLSLTSSI